jgi:predicted HNH restriction endonuclease
MTNRKAFTHDELVLCVYAALYDINDFGGLDQIHRLQSRSVASIRMKIQNIVAMCDEAGVPRHNSENPLTGLPHGQAGRRTNWDMVSHYSGVSREQHLHECKLIIQESGSWPDEISDNTTHVEGARRSVLVNAYERDPVARQKCIDHFGAACVICGFDFGIVFGPDASGFIHVHHLTPLSEIGQEYLVDPVRDLRPVCPNCHAVIHLNREPKSIEEVRGMLQRDSREVG